MKCIKCKVEKKIVWQGLCLGCYTAFCKEERENEAQQKSKIRWKAKKEYKKSIFPIIFEKVKQEEFNNEN